MLDLKLDGIISKEVLKFKQQEIKTKILELEKELETLSNLDITKKNRIDQINRITEVINAHKRLDKFNDEIFKTLVDKIIIGEETENEKENLFKIKFVLKTGEMIINSLPYDKYSSSTKLGRCSFNIKEQKENIKDENLTVYVLDKKCRL